jgi:hypothetical protein
VDEQVDCCLELASWPPCWSSSQGAESGSGKTTAWPDPFVLAVVLGLNGCFSLDGSLLVDQLRILTWCSPSEC